MAEIISKINPKLIVFLEEHKPAKICVFFDQRGPRINFACEDCKKSATCKYKEILKREYQTKTEIHFIDGNFSFSSDFSTYSECVKYLSDKYNLQVSKLIPTTPPEFDGD